uniref:A kinase (PRKA) interacting protein 1 n=1 Tax=Tetraodon nigroviridis TaxID=99883 RepID=H3C9U2_TETNG
MKSQAWLDSLRRSASLAQEVLERASRRAVDWNDPGLTRTSSTPDAADDKKTRTERDVFASVAGSMAQVAGQCERFYNSGCCSEPSDGERRHLSRFHSSPGSGNVTPATTPDIKNHLSPSDEDVDEDVDVDIRVAPGTYAVTASMADSEQQTLLVSLKAGESFKLKFNF